MVVLGKKGTCVECSLCCVEHCEPFLARRYYTAGCSAVRSVGCVVSPEVNNPMWLTGLNTSTN